MDRRHLVHQGDLDAILSGAPSETLADVKEQAWDQGHRTAYLRYHDYDHIDVNPYRKRASE